MPLLLPLLLLACVEEEEPETEDTEDTEEPVEVDDCETLEIRVNGEDPPAVGDEWTIFLWCDDALMTGATRIYFEPNDFAAVSENVAQFLYAGDAVMTVQVGSRRQTRDVTVTD